MCKNTESHMLTHHVYIVHLTTVKSSSCIRLISHMSRREGTKRGEKGLHATVRMKGEFKQGQKKAQKYHIYKTHRIFHRHLMFVPPSWRSKSLGKPLCLFLFARLLFFCFEKKNNGNKNRVMKVRARVVEASGVSVFCVSYLMSETEL